MEFNKSIDNHNHTMKIKFYTEILSTYVNNNNDKKNFKWIKYSIEI